MRLFIFVFLFLFICPLLQAQDVDTKAYKNQIGYDMRSLIVKYGGGLNEQFEFDFLYRRELNQKSWLTTKFVLRNSNNDLAKFRHFLTEDSIAILNNLRSTSNQQFQLNYSRVKKLKNVKFYYGVSFLYMYMQGFIHTNKYDFTQYPRAGSPINYISIDVIENDYHQIGISPSVSLELLLGKRWSILMNGEIFYTRSFGSWRYVNSDGREVFSPINETLILNDILIRDIALMYKF